MREAGRSARTAALGTILFVLFVGPGPVIGLVPLLLSGWRLRPPFLGWAPFRLIGVALLLLGLPVLVDALIGFVRRGRGTPAPVAPPERLVAVGAYRWVRNPMYVAVVAMILGQALLLGSAAQDAVVVGGVAIFGGSGTDGTRNFFAGLGFRTSLAMAFIAGLSELGGGLLFAFGLVTPFAALALTVVMLNAIGTVHWKKGFFNSAGGYEYNLLIIATAVAVTAAGPGRFSLDHILGARRHATGS